MPEIALLVTCEHAVNDVPDAWRHLFRDDDEVLGSHRGWDPGSLELGRKIAAELSVPCFAARITRLLVDHNRSPHNRSLWSDFSRLLPTADRTRLLEDYYHPFRDQVGRWVAARLARGDRVVHLSVHSFTPVLDGKVRKVDIGLLYDPRRSAEVVFAKRWKTRLAATRPPLRVCCNKPYRGRSDCHLNAYRGLYAERDYCGIELEVNQTLVGSQPAWRDCQQLLIATLRETLIGLSGED